MYKENVRTMGNHGDGSAGFFGARKDQENRPRGPDRGPDLNVERGLADVQ